MEGRPKWWILSKNKTQNNTAVIIKIIDTVKKEIRSKMGSYNYVFAL